jgi:hypothetical protein
MWAFKILFSRDLVSLLLITKMENPNYVMDRKCVQCTHNTHVRYTVYTSSHSQPHRYPQAPSCKLLISPETWKEYINGKKIWRERRTEWDRKIARSNLSLGVEGEGRRLGE